MAASAPFSVRRPLAAAFVLLPLFLLLTLGQAWRLGGFDSDLGGDPDEGAHAVTSLMVRDYLVTGLPQMRSPLAFAEQYYQTFPKVALGHYPPGYYLPAAAALALWCDPRVLILLQCLLAALLGLAAWAFLRRAWPGQGGGAVALLLAVTVMVQGEVARVSVHVLADLLLVLWVFAATVVWMAWLKRPSWARALGFGFLAAAAILTKASALGLAGVPLLTLVFTRRWSDLKRGSWWGSAIPVAVLAGPWQVWSVRFTQEGFTGDSPAVFFVKAVAEYAGMAPWFFGWPVLVLISSSLIRSLDTAMRDPAGLDGQRACLWATCLGMQGLAMAVPTGFSPRYLLPSLLPALLLAVLELPRWLPAKQARLRVLLAALLLGATILLLWRDRPKSVHGYSAAVATVLARPPAAQDRAWLVSSDGRGEGALIADIAFRTSDRSGTTRHILRGSKELADTDWVGKHYLSKFKDDAALLAHLDKLQVDAVFADLSMAENERKPHEAHLKQALDAATRTWDKLPSQAVIRVAGSQPGELAIYVRRNGAGVSPVP